MRRTFCSEMGAREAKKWQLARPRGFEPLAPRFVAWCSVQLSYGRVNVALSWNCVEASILCGFSTMRLGRDTRGYRTAGEAWPRPYSRAPESHMCLNLNISNLGFERIGNACLRSNASGIGGSIYV